MKRIYLTLALMLFAFGSASAGVHHFSPTPADMFDLDHGAYYGWGIDHDFGDEKISNVFLTVKNVNNWWPEPNMLFINMMDQMDAGLYVGDDTASVVLPDDIQNFYDGQGVVVDSWTDTDGGPNGDWVDLNYDFASMGLLDDFISFSADGNFGFGFDPDCHFFNDKIQLTVVTDTPEPATMLLFALGLAGGAVRRKFKHKA